MEGRRACPGRRSEAVAADYRKLVDAAIDKEFDLWLNQDVPQNPGVLDLVYALLDSHAVSYTVESERGKETIIVDRSTYT